MPSVTVIGAGVAGMAAALRLAERGFEVTLYEQDAHVGGKFGIHESPHTGLKHEHSYHMFLNWYHQFWALVDELGIRDRFVPRPSLSYVREGEFPHMTKLTNVGSPDHFVENLFSGVLPPADLWIYGYSLLDLLTHPLRRGEFLGMISVNGFMYSRPYQTDRAAEHHHRTLAKAFASYSYNTSASTYKTFIKYGFKDPTPMTWSMTGNCHDTFLVPLQRRLEALGCKVRTLHRVKRMVLDDAGRVSALEVARVNRSPSEESATPVEEVSCETVAVSGDVILAVPPGAVTTLADADVLAHAPELALVENLRSEPMAALDLYFRRRLPDIPADHVVLMGSPHHLTFIDHAQLWEEFAGQDRTVLSVVASETHGFAALGHDRALALILDELRQYIPFSNDDVDFERSHLQTNTGDQLLVHDVGSWNYRPEARCGIRNLYLAGDYCRTFVDVVTVEGAIVSGMVAAEAIRSRLGVGTPIETVEPEEHPAAALTALKWALAPYAMAARGASFSADELKRALTVGSSKLD